MEKIHKQKRMNNKSLQELNNEASRLQDELSSFFEKYKDPNAFESEEDAMEAYYKISNELNDVIPKIIEASFKNRGKRNY